MILVEQHGFPYVNVRAYFRVGPAFDPPGKEGLTALTGRMLARGTQKRDRAAYEEAVEVLGADIFAAAQRHSNSFGGSVLSHSLEPFAELMAEALTTPAFDLDELGKVKRETVADLVSARDDDSMLVGRWFRRRVFEGHRLGHSASGLMTSVPELTRDDVVAHYDAHFTRANCLVAASGDIDHAQLDTMFATPAAIRPEGTAADWRFDEVSFPDGRVVALVDKPERSQSQIIIGHPALPADHPDFLAVQLGSVAFGGTFTSRLMEEVRVKRGWSYGAHASIAPEPFCGYFSMSCAPATEYTPDAARLMLDEFEKFVGDGLTDDEIEFARGYLCNTFAFAIETAAQRASQFVTARLLGRPDDYVERFVERLRALTPDEIRDAVRRHLHPDRVHVLVVCTADDVRDSLSDLPGVTAVDTIPFDAV